MSLLKTTAYLLHVKHNLGIRYGCMITSKTLWT